MRLSLQLVAVVLSTTAVGAQQAGTSPKPSDPSSTSGAPTPPAGAQSSPTPPAELPASLERIREGLAKPAPGSTLKNVELKADFVLRVEERDHFLKILDALKIERGPAPLGGLNAHEQRERAFPKTERPLMQPSAAFSGGELLTLAIQGLAQRFLGGALVNAVSNSQRARAKQAAVQEVAAAIAEYCDAQPDGGRSLHLCTEVISR
ncbi:MAG: hypothetical protein FJW27_11300 [Acidimicrobiia bacterium]|nr:hypothetical protein [Acidimicrobiia bacterium]